MELLRICARPKIGSMTREHMHLLMFDPSCRENRSADALGVVQRPVVQPPRFPSKAWHVDSLTSLMH